jgi:prepilin-type N-terminal cleavage/methylation domain-containing protein/prepilin-type processing-associated H-X9-DG protein
MKNTSDLCERRERGVCGFTLTELLVVVAMLAVLSLTALPAMSHSKSTSRTARCSSNMRLWGQALQMYLADNRDHLPYFGGDSSASLEGKNWIDWLAPYVDCAAEPGSWFTNGQGSPSYYSSPTFTNDVRKCPAGKPVGDARGWSAYIGANFGYSGADPLSGPFYYGNNAGAYNPPLSMTRIRKPSDAMAFMDCYSFWVYSPVYWPFDLDYDGDGRPDSASSGFGTYGVPYNFALPKIHENGANVTLLDGHVERAAYQDLWRVSASGKVLHSFWYLTD